MTVDEREPDVDLLASVAPRHWAPIVFGVVPQGANRRRPSDVVRVFTAGLIVVLCGIGAHNVAKLEARVFDLIAALPDWTQEFAEFWFKVGTFGAVAAVTLALLLRDSSGSFSCSRSPGCSAISRAWASARSWT